MAAEWYYDEDYGDPDRDPEDEWACEFGVDCLMPGEHLRHECYTVEMAQAWQEEQAIDEARFQEYVKGVRENLNRRLKEMES